MEQKNTSKTKVLTASEADLADGRHPKTKNHAKYPKIFPKKRRVEKDKVERDLEALVFGGDVEDLAQEVYHRIEQNTDESYDPEIEEEEEKQKSIPDLNQKPNKIKNGEEEETSDKPLFVIDTKGSRVSHNKLKLPQNISGSSKSTDSAKEQYEDDDDDDEDEKEEKDSESILTEVEGDKDEKRAWVDPDDKEVSISLAKRNMLRKLRKTEDEDTISGDKFEIRLRKQHAKLHPTPGWAVLPSELKKQKKRKKRARSSESESSDASEQQYSDEDIELLRQSHGFLQKEKPKFLPPEDLEVVRMRDANQKAYSQSVIQSISFHPNAQVLMTAGLDKTLRLFQIDGKYNSKIQSIFLEDLPIRKASFNPSGTEIIATGRRPYFYSYNVEAGRIEKIPKIHGRQEKSYEDFSISPCGGYIVFAGRDGYLILINSQTKQWIANMKINDSIKGFDWSGDGKYLFCIGGDADIYQWDVGARRCVHRFQDDGGFKPTSIALSNNDEYIAIGSRSGIVNIYDKSCLLSIKPKPLKAISNLTTAVHKLEFNHDSQILGMSSHSKKGQLKMVHLPSLTVFKNWPTSGTPLDYVESFDFSPNSGYIAIGNSKGKVPLYRLRHFATA
ncbi:hypothetical protein G9A89_013417 [Geosiphon pyriformis]|nr:hypothetical protein G9A89_013417 [Geosiphon pyriformis]